MQFLSQRARSRRALLNSGGGDPPAPSELTYLGAFRLGSSDGNFNGDCCLCRHPDPTKIFLTISRPSSDVNGHAKYVEVTLPSLDSLDPDAVNAQSSTPLTGAPANQVDVAADYAATVTPSDPSYSPQGIRIGGIMLDSSDRLWVNVGIHYHTSAHYYPALAEFDTSTGTRIGNYRIARADVDPPTGWPTPNGRLTNLSGTVLSSYGDYLTTANWNLPGPQFDFAWRDGTDYLGFRDGMHHTNELMFNENPMPGVPRWDIQANGSGIIIGDYLYWPHYGGTPPGWYGSGDGTGNDAEVVTSNYAGGISGVTSATTKVGTQTGDAGLLRHDDGNYHVMTHSGNAIDINYQFSLGTDGYKLPLSVRAIGYLAGSGNTITVSAWNHVGATWESIGTINGTDSATDSTNTITLAARHAGTSGGENSKVYIRFHCTGQTSPVLHLDRLTVQYYIANNGDPNVQTPNYVPDTLGASTGTHSPPHNAYVYRTPISQLIESYNGTRDAYDFTVEEVTQFTAKLWRYETDESERKRYLAKVNSGFVMVGTKLICLENSADKTRNSDEPAPVFHVFETA
jgi:hypothetical protein